MPPFSAPINADFLLPIIKIFLSISSAVFSLILAVGPIGQIALIAIVIALYARNIMGPARP